MGMSVGVFSRSLLWKAPSNLSWATNMLPADSCLIKQRSFLHKHKHRHIVVKAYECVAAATTGVELR